MRPKKSNLKKSKPPLALLNIKSNPFSSSNRIKDIHTYLKDIDKQGIDELSQSVNSMNDQTLFDSIQNIEKLYMKLMIEYNYEL